MNHIPKDDKDADSISLLLKQARESFENTEIAEDFKTFEIKMKRVKE